MEIVFNKINNAQYDNQQMIFLRFWVERMNNKTVMLFYLHESRLQSGLPLSCSITSFVPIVVEPFHSFRCFFRFRFVARVFGQVASNHVDRHHQRFVAVKLHQKFAMVLQRRKEFTVKTNKYTNKQINKQIHKQTNKQTNKNKKNRNKHFKYH